MGRRRAFIPVIIADLTRLLEADGRIARDDVTSVLADAGVEAA